MKKRLLAMMMAIVMVMTLLPTSALAAGGVGEPSETNSGAVFSKTATQDADGTVKITLEAWATGQTVETTKQQPLDIVLVLDQSGSMADSFDKKTSRQTAMKNAVNGFIDEVAKNYTEGAAHRISIVTFDDKASQLKDWTSVDETGKTALRTAVDGLPTTPSGATNVAAGMAQAQTQLSNAQKDHKKVVVVFTDGVPTTYSDFSTEVATNAIATAKALKDEQTEIYTIGIFNGVNADQLYGEKWAYLAYDDVPCTGEVGSYWGGSWAAGLFGGNDFAAIDVAAGNRFLNYLSSNFAEATRIGVERGRYDPSNTWVKGDGYQITQNFNRSSSDYYLTATNSESLNNVFTQISENINSAVNEKLNTKAVVKDTMTDYFNLPTNPADIKVYTQNRKADGNWADRVETTGTTVKIDGQTVTVTGYDYAQNFVSETAKSDGSYGQKLVIEFTITPDLAKLAQAEQVKVDTNTGAGLYLGETAVATGESGKASFCGVKYDDNGGTGTVPATQIGANGTKFTVPASCNTLKKDKAVLLGFSDTKRNALVTNESDAADVVTEYAPAKDTLATLYAVWAEDKNGDGTPDYSETKYTITYAAGTEDTVNNMPAEVTGVLANTEQTVSTVKPTREGYIFSGWQAPEGVTVTDNKFTMPEKNVTFTAQWTANDVTIIFDANGGAWAADVAGYKMDDGKTTASKTYEPSKAVAKIPTDPVRDGKKFSGWGVKLDESGKPSDKIVAYPLLETSATAAAHKRIFGEKPIIFYAMWEDAAQPTEKLNYTIHQHYIGSNGKQDAQFNDELPKTASAGTKISKLIPAELQKDRKYYYQTYIYLSSETKIVNDNVATPVADGTVLNKDNTQIHLYYYLDAWNDKNDTLTGGDGIPDKYQAVVTYKVVGGTWKDGKTDDQVQVFTLKTKNKETGVWEDVTPAPTLGNTIPTGMISSYSRTASQSWDKDITKDTKVTESVTYTYTFTKGSSGGGSSGGGGGRKPTVDIPDDVPTGLNGDDHFAYIVGYPDGNVKPGGNITRAEVATIFFRLLTEDVRTANSTQANSLSDVSRGQWFNHAISTLSSMGIVKGNPDGTFDPDAPITRAEFAAIAARFDDKNTNNTSNFSDIASHWAKDEIGVAANKGWINGYPDSTFRPDQYITRAEAMTLVNRVLNRLPEKSEDLLDDMIKWPDNADASVWYYLAVQEATNSHDYSDKSDADKYEKWTKLRENRDWTELEK